MRYLFSLFLIVLNYCFLFSQDKIRIGIFNNQSLQVFVVSVSNSKYAVYGDNIFLKNIEQKNPIYVSKNGEKISVFDKNNQLGLFKEIKLNLLNDSGIFKIKPVEPAMLHRIYSGNLIVQIDYNRLQLINEVSQDEYLAGVVQAECGAGRLPEFYKAHAVISRTYMYQNINKHSQEGFMLCDGVHCMAYKSRSEDDRIIDAVKATRGLILTYNDTTLVTAAFHANCGGETENSGNVWLQDLPYLKSVRDPYCVASRGAIWTKIITLDKWKEYLIKNGIDIFNYSPAQFSFSQPSRQRYYTISDGNRKDQLLLRKIREDWDLKSTFFSVEINDDEVIIKGRGYGHGVGLCQEGAMQMAKKGKNFQEILLFYYTNVKISMYEDWLSRIAAPNY